MAAIIGSASAIPNIFGGFAPFPNTIATALLAYQSEAIGYGFGIKFQYSKRLIGAMTNEEFNALDPIKIGNIVEAHNSELIKRMNQEMPKWLDIQRDFIEASVEVEIAKARRTPSAWAEIIQAFAGAAGQQIADSLNALDPAALQAILLANPILALIYHMATGGAGTEPIPPTLPPDVPETIYDADADPPQEEWITNFNRETQLSYSYLATNVDPPTVQNITTPPINAYESKQQIKAFLQNTNSEPLKTTLINRGNAQLQASHDFWGQLP